MRTWIVGYNNQECKTIAKKLMVDLHQDNIIVANYSQGWAFIAGYKIKSNDDAFDIDGLISLNQLARYLSIQSGINVNTPIEYWMPYKGEK